MKAARSTAAVISFAVSLAIAPVAARSDSSDDIPPKARALAQRGRAFHDAGNYTGAIAAFTQAYVIAPSPALLFNLAQAYRLQGNCDDAALMYHRFLATNPGPEQRALAESHLASVERCLHKIALHIPIETASGQLAAAPSSELTGTVDTAQPIPRRAQIEKDFGIGLALGGGVSLALAAYYAVQAHDAESDVSAAYAKGARQQDVAARDADGRSASKTAKVFGAGGAIGLAGGIVTYLVGRHNEHPPVTVSTSRHSVELGLTWAF